MKSLALTVRRTRLCEIDRLNELWLIVDRLVGRGPEIAIDRRSDRRFPDALGHEDAGHVLPGVGISSSGLSMRLRTLRFASSGSSGSTGSSRRSFASSTRIIAAAAVIGLVIEAMRKIVSRRIGSLPPKALTPIASTCVSPRRLTSVTRPGIRPLSTWRSMASRMRARRDLDNPPLPEGELAPACGDCALTTAGTAKAADAAAVFRNILRSVPTATPTLQ